MSTRIECPYCESRDIKLLSEIDKEYDIWEAYQLSEAECENCEKIFYISLFYDIVDVEVKKDKYD